MVDVVEEYVEALLLISVLNAPLVLLFIYLGRVLVLLGLSHSVLLVGVFNMTLVLGLCFLDNSVFGPNVG